MVSAQGGHTAFPTLNPPLSVKPKKGKALLWPSTLDADPDKQDASTMHEAMPVIRGTKYAANSWLHLYNYEVPNLWGCTGKSALNKPRFVPALTSVSSIRYFR